MKTILMLFTCMLCSFNSLSQDKGVTTATISVKGNCEECKKRIENAADIKGVKFSDWNEHTQAITVTYKADKVSLDQIEKAIAASGHDTKNFKSDKPAYSQLPSCCKYRDKSCENGKK